MAARSGQKLKLIYIADIFKKCTDEEHPISAAEICDKLAALGVTAERKAIYDDIQQLILYGYDIIKTRTPKNGFFLASREFETSEIYLLCDAVKTAKFISAKKTRELVSKLEGMLSIYQSTDKLNAVFIDYKSKCQNEEIFYSIDAIDRAIAAHKKISLKYGVRTLGSNREIKTEYKERVISPYALTWQDDHYYLIGNYEKYDNLIHLRVDRMRKVKELDVSARPFSEVSEYKDTFDVADYTKKLFGMFGGKTEEIELICSKSILEIIADRFSQDIFIRNLTEDTFTVTVKAAVSDALITWIMNYGDKIKVSKPSYLIEKIRDRAEEIIKIYDKN